MSSSSISSPPLTNNVADLHALHYKVTHRKEKENQTEEKTVREKNRSIGWMIANKTKLTILF